MGLLGLVGLTAWVVASISVWWVLGYLALMVLIFVTPGRRPLATSSEGNGESVNTRSANFQRSLCVDWTDGVDQHPHVAEPDAGVPSRKLIEPVRSGLESVGVSTSKFRRGQVRARKAARTAAELMPVSPSVTWIQVGPGRFIRAEGGIHTVSQVQFEEGAVGTDPETDVPIHPPPILTVPAECAAAQEPSSPLATRAGGVEMVADECVMGSVIEEYGIAPSAFSPAPLVTSLVEDLALSASEVVANPRVDPGSTANLGKTIPWHGVDAELPRSNRQMSDRHAAWVSPGIRCAVSDFDRSTSRRNSRRGPKPRPLVMARLRKTCAGSKQCACFRELLTLSVPFDRAHRLVSETCVWAGRFCPAGYRRELFVEVASRWNQPANLETGREELPFSLFNDDGATFVSSR